MKIRASYTEEAEAEAILQALRPLADMFTVKKCEGTPPYRYLYFVPKKGGKACRRRDAGQPPYPLTDN